MEKFCRAVIKVILCVVIGVSLVHCVSKHRRHHRNLKVSEYKIHKSNDSTDFVWFYIIDANNSSYYYYESSSKVTDFKPIQWAKSEKDPLEEIDEEEIDEDNDITVDVSNTTITTEMEQDVSNEESESTDAEDDASDGGDGSSSGDSGSDGGSGGDGGGGDGGGGDGGD